VHHFLCVPYSPRENQTADGPAAKKRRLVKNDSGAQVASQPSFTDVLQRLQEGESKSGKVFIISRLVFVIYSFCISLQI
jgi:hypothetical protein